MILVSYPKRRADCSRKLNGRTRSVSSTQLFNPRSAPVAVRRVVASSDRLVYLGTRPNILITVADVATVNVTVCRSGIFSFLLLSGPVIAYTKHMKYQYHKLTYSLPFIALIGLFLIFSLTNPLSAGPAGMLLVFFLVYVLFASVFFIFLHVGLGVISKILNRYKEINFREWKIGVRKSYYIASVLAFGPVLLLAMRSVGQLQLRDVVLTVAFLSIAIFYVMKRS